MTCSSCKTEDILSAIVEKDYERVSKLVNQATDEQREWLIKTLKHLAKNYEDDALLKVIPDPLRYSEEVIRNLIKDDDLNGFEEAISNMTDHERSNLKNMMKDPSFYGYMNEEIFDMLISNNFIPNLRNLRRKDLVEQYLSTVKPTPDIVINLINNLLYDQDIFRGYIFREILVYILRSGYISSKLLREKPNIGSTEEDLSKWKKSVKSFRDSELEKCNQKKIPPNKPPGVKIVALKSKRKDLYREVSRNIILKYDSGQYFALGVGENENCMSDLTDEDEKFINRTGLLISVSMDPDDDPGLDLLEIGDKLYRETTRDIIVSEIDGDYIAIGALDDPDVSVTLNNRSNMRPLNEV